MYGAVAARWLVAVVQVTRHDRCSSEDGVSCDRGPCCDGDTVELELCTIRNPVSHAETHPEMILPEGLVTKRGKLAASKVFRVTDTVDYDHSGQYAALATFEYAG